MVTGTTGPTKCMFTVMRTTTIVLFTAIDNFQFNPVTPFSVGSQLRAGVAGASERPHGVHTAVAAVGKPFGTLVYVSAGLFVFRQLVARVTGTPGHSILTLTDVGTSIPTCAGVHLYAGACISMEPVSCITLTVEGAQSVNTALLAASIHHRTFIDIFTSSAIFLQLPASLTSAVITANCITALVLAATIVNGALIYIILTVGSLKTLETLARLGLAV